MKKINKNKKVIIFITDYDEIKKGTKKMLPISRANDLIKKKIAKLVPDETAKLKFDVDQIAINNKNEIAELKKEITELKKKVKLFENKSKK